MDIRERYEAKKATDARRGQENQPAPWWWLGQRDPVARFTKWLAIYTFALVIATIASSVVLIITDHTLKRQAELTEGQLAVMKRQFESAERPWIAVSFIPSGPMVFDKNGGSFPIKITLKNTGHTPAIGLTVFGEGYFPITVEDILAKQKEICETFSFSAAPSSFGDIVFPGETIDLDTEADFTPGEIERGRRLTDGVRLYQNPTVGICVNYRFSFDMTDEHQTAVAFQIFRKNPIDDNRILNILPEGTIPLSEIVFNAASRLSVGHQAN